MQERLGDVLGSAPGEPESDDEAFEQVRERVQALISAARALSDTCADLADALRPLPGMAPDDPIVAGFGRLRAERTAALLDEAASAARGTLGLLHSAYGALDNRRARVGPPVPPVDMGTWPDAFVEMSSRAFTVEDEAGTAAAQRPWVRPASPDATDPHGIPAAGSPMPDEYSAGSASDESAETDELTDRAAAADEPTDTALRAPVDPAETVDAAAALDEITDDPAGTAAVDGEAADAAPEPVESTDEQATTAEAVPDAGVEAADAAQDEAANAADAAAGMATFASAAPLNGATDTFGAPTGTETDAGVTASEPADALGGTTSEATEAVGAPTSETADAFGAATSTATDSTIPTAEATDALGAPTGTETDAAATTTTEATDASGTPTSTAADAARESFGAPIGTPPYVRSSPTGEPTDPVAVPLGIATDIAAARPDEVADGSGAAESEPTVGAASRATGTTDALGAPTDSVMKTAVIPTDELVDVVGVGVGAAAGAGDAVAEEAESPEGDDVRHAEVPVEAVAPGPPMEVTPLGADESDAGPDDLDGEGLRSWASPGREWARRIGAVESTAHESAAHNAEADNGTTDGSTAEHSTAHESAAHKAEADDGTTDGSTAEHSTAHESTAHEAEADDSTTDGGTADDGTADETTADGDRAEEAGTVGEHTRDDIEIQPRISERPAPPEGEHTPDDVDGEGLRGWATAAAGPARVEVAAAALAGWIVVDPDDADDEGHPIPERAVAAAPSVDRLTLPVPDLDPDLLRDPRPDPVRDPLSHAEPDPFTSPVSGLAVDAAPDPFASPVSGLAVDAAPDPFASPVSGLAVDAEPDPLANPASEPAVDAEPDPFVGPLPGPVSHAEPDPFANAVDAELDPLANPVSGLAVDAEPDPFADPVHGLLPDADSDPAPYRMHDPLRDPVLDALSDPGTGPSTDQIIDPGTGPGTSTGPIIDPAADPDGPGWHGDPVSAEPRSLSLVPPVPDESDPDESELPMPPAADPWAGGGEWAGIDLSGAAAFARANHLAWTAAQPAFPISGAEPDRQLPLEKPLDEPAAAVLARQAEAARRHLQAALVVANGPAVPQQVGSLLTAIEQVLTAVTDLARETRGLLESGLGERTFPGEARFLCSPPWEGTNLVGRDAYGDDVATPAGLAKLLRALGYEAHSVTSAGGMAGVQIRSPRYSMQVALVEPAGGGRQRWSGALEWVDESGTSRTWAETLGPVELEDEELARRVDELLRRSVGG